MLTALHEQLLTCVEMLGDFQPPHPQNSTLNPLYLCANIDAMYHVVLDHHLSADWSTPSVPPPHAYLRALAAPIRAQRLSAARAVLARVGSAAATAFCSAWDVDAESLELPKDADPLRQVRVLP
jgi:hypothetical protein